MTKRLPWPRWALWAREDSRGAAREIDRLGEEAKRALEAHNHYMVRIAVVEMQRLAGKIVAKLAEVEADGSDACRDCPYREG